MPKPSVHIISMDVPYPPDYGGVIDVFYKVKALSEMGVLVNLHAFEYGRGSSKEISRLCNRVFYYPRKTHWSNAVTTMPYIVRSRISDDLIENLTQDNLPIICEGLHTAAILLSDKIDPARVYIRAANVEHHYYRHLFKDESSIFKKIYYFTEAQRLYHFERNLSKAAGIIAISEADADYFKVHFQDTPVHTVFGFHAYNDLEIRKGKGDYALYHGNLSVSENHNAAKYLIEKVFSKLDYPFIISGKHPEAELKELAEKHPHIQIIANPDMEEMHKLIADAHIHVMPTFQPTGMKLKLLNSLFSGRHVIVNEDMLAGTDLHSIVNICFSAKEIISKIQELKDVEVDENFIAARKPKLETAFTNEVNARKLVGIIQGT